MMNNTPLMNEDSHRIPQDLFTETAPYYRFGWVKVLWCDKDYEADENDDDNDNKEIVKVDLIIKVKIMVINEDSHQEFFIRIWLLRLRIGLAQQILEGRRKNRFLRNYSKLVTPLKRLGKRNLFATFCWKSRVCKAKKNILSF